MSVVAFDLDGTLEDSRNDMVAAVLRARGSLMLPERAPAQIRPHVNRGMDHLYRTCFDELLSPESAGHTHAHQPGTSEWSVSYDRIKLLYEREYGAHIADETRLYEGIYDALHAIAARGHTLALVTNKPEGLSEQLLEALNIRALFSAVVGGDTCEHSKPNPEPLRTAIERCGGGQAVMVGDSQGDVRCAQSAGIPIIWCAWGYAETVAPLVPDWTAKTPSQLSDIIPSALAGTTA